MKYKINMNLHRKMVVGLVSILVFSLVWELPAQSRSVEAIMDDLAQVTAELDTQISSGRLESTSLNKANTLSTLFRELDSTYDPRYRGREEDWRTFCQDSLVQVDNLSLALAEGDSVKAKSAMEALDKIRVQAHQEFRPGLMKWIKNLFSTKKNTK